MPTKDTAHLPAKRSIRRALPLIGIGIAAILGAVFLRDTLSFETLRENQAALLAIRDDNYALSGIAFVALYALIVAFSLPGATIATLTGGFLFGIFPGTLFNMVGATIGATGIFLAARWGVGERIARSMDTSDGRIHEIKKGLDDNQWSMLFLIRLVPVVPFFMANLVPAFVGVPLGRFVISTFLGILPGALVYTSVGAGLGSVFASGQSPDLGIVFTPQIFLPLLGLSALAALPIAIKAFQRAKGK